MGICIHKQRWNYKFVYEVTKRCNIAITEDLLHESKLCGEELVSTKKLLRILNVRSLANTISLTF